MSAARHLPAGACLPDYAGGGIVNLMSSLIRSRGGRSPHPELRGLPARELRGFRRVVYLVVDGMGEAQLQRFLAAGRGRAFFARHARRQATSVFPATTSAAVTTFGTGASPAEHAVLGWHLNLPDLGLVATILPAVTRTGVPLAPPAFRLKRYLALPRHVATVRGRRILLSYGHIPRSRYAMATAGWGGRLSYSTLRGMERRIVAAARAPGRGLVYAYWPELDTLCHRFGCSHRRTVRHFDAIDRSLARLARLLAGTGAALVVTADHGLIDNPPLRRVDLAAVPGFMACLATLPAGDARQVQCFVRPAKKAAFLAIARGRLARACACLPGRALLAGGMLGPGRRHPALAGRVGDYVLIARGGHAFGVSLPGAQAEFNAASHGGLSEDEMRVPVFLVTGRATPAWLRRA